MPNVFDSILDNEFMLLSIISSKSDTPKKNELQEISSVVAKNYGHAFHIGGGKGSDSLNQYYIGYLLPKGTVIRLNQTEIIQQLSECSYFEKKPAVNLASKIPEDFEVKRARIIGNPPSEKIDGLKDFKEELEEQI